MPKVELKPGDAVSYKDIQNNDQASAIADAFIKAGAEPGEGYPYLENPDGLWKVLLWDAKDNCTNRIGAFHDIPFDVGEEGIERFLTPEQVLAED